MNADFNNHTNDTDCGREFVREALIRAAGEMLAKLGPKTMSVRKVAAKAGVNHGQVHHYFGGKSGLIQAAMSHLALEHYENAKKRSGDSPLPEPLTLGEDSLYLQSIVRLVMDGDVNIASQEIETSNSVPIEARQYVERNYPIGEVPIEVKARFAISAAIELGWAALETYILQLADVKESDKELVRKSARTIAREFWLNEPKLAD